jgi:hypothetical protein
MFVMDFHSECLLSIITRIHFNVPIPWHATALNLHLVPQLKGLLKLDTPACLPGAFFLQCLELRKMSMQVNLCDPPPSHQISVEVLLSAIAESLVEGSISGDKDATPTL